MIVPLADAASVWTFYGALLIAVGTVGTFLGFLMPSESKWSDNASTLGPLGIGLGTAVTFGPSFASYREHHEALAYAGFSVVTLIVLLLAVSAWRTFHHDPPQRRRRNP